MKSLLEFKQEAIIVEKPKEEWNRLYLELLDLIKSWGFEDKSKVLNSLNGNWVFDHYKEVKDFMDQYNDKYLKLFEIKRLFPLEVEIENV